MRLGGHVFIEQIEDPEAYARAHVQAGFRAAYCPGGLKAGEEARIAAYVKSFKDRNLVCAEVGSWCNPLSLDKSVKAAAVAQCVERLTLSEEIGARCCVNIIGTRGEENWFGPDARNYDEDFFAEAVDVYRAVIDAVKPKRTKMTFELMPFNFLDTAEAYVRFLRAVDRPAAGVHLDPVNCITSPRLYYDNGAFLEHIFSVLGREIVSVHAKDIALRGDVYSVMLSEVPIGQGAMDYVTFLRCMSRLPGDTPIMLEHYPDERTYADAAQTLRAVAKANFITL